MMVEISIPLILDIIRTAGILVAIIYYITIMRNTQKTRELTLESRTVKKSTGTTTRNKTSFTLYGHVQRVPFRTREPNPDPFYGNGVR